MPRRHRSQWSPDRIKALRHQLGENVATFGQRLAKSGRAIEEWEQGRRAPDALACRVLDTLAKRHRLPAAS